MNESRIDEFMEALENVEFELVPMETEEAEKVICDICGELVNEEDTICVDGAIVCKDCEEDNVVTCEKCGCAILTDTAHHIDFSILCDDCFEDLYAPCDDCGEYVYRDYLYTTFDGDQICESCKDMNYLWCSHCDELFHRDDLVWDEDEEEYYCEACYREYGDKPIKNYYYKPNPIFYGKTNLENIGKDNTMYLGVELEIDKGGEDRNNARELLNIANENNEHIYIKHDGSLDRGFEIVSHPMTLEYHKNNIAWDELMQKAGILGYRSHDTETCGLHVHVSRDSLGETYGQREDTISRIIYLMENNWREILTFTRRSERNLDHWARRYGIEKDIDTTYKKVKKNGNRYMNINLQNDETIEFRIFRGTLKHSTFLATLELVNCICELCKITDMQTIEKMTWFDFVSNIDESVYPELIEYLKNKDLYI